MNEEKALDIVSLFSKVLGEKVKEFDLPPPSFTVMQAEIIAFDEVGKTLLTKMPVLKAWLNPYGTMQGGFINAAIDNAVGPLSMLVAPLNFTRTMETKYIKGIGMDVGYIYVKATLVEEKRKRLTFEVEVTDKEGMVYSKAKVVNWIVA